MDLGAIVQLGDCEAIGGGWLRQPVNAWSSLAFGVVGVAIVVGARSTGGRERAARIVFGVLLIATGAGSFLFHGPQPASGEFVHDLTFLTALWFLIVANVAGARGEATGHTEATGRTRTDRTGVLLVLAGIATIAALLAVDGGVTNILTAVLALALIGSDLLLWKRAAPSPGWYGLAIASLLIGIGLFVAGRTGSPLCDPDGLAQAHAGWHVFAAIFLGAYVLATVPARTKSAGTVPAGTEPPHTEPPHTEPPHTEPPHTEPPHTEPPHTEADRG
jgi:hypothetical protein